MRVLRHGVYSTMPAQASVGRVSGRGSWSTREAYLGEVAHPLVPRGGLDSVGCNSLNAVETLGDLAPRMGLEPATIRVTGKRGDLLVIRPESKCKDFAGLNALSSQSGSAKIV